MENAILCRLGSRKEEGVDGTVHQTTLIEFVTYHKLLVVEMNQCGNYLFSLCQRFKPHQLSKDNGPIVLPLFLMLLHPIACVHP